jgi:hypothetical protein
MLDSSRSASAGAARPSFRSAGAILAFTATALPRVAAAQPPDPALIQRISHQIDTLGDLEKRASFREEQLTEEVDGDGKVASAETRVSRVEADGKTSHKILEQCTKDGKDVTAEERAKAEKGAKSNEKNVKKEKRLFRRICGRENESDVAFGARHVARIAGSGGRPARELRAERR